MKANLNKASLQGLADSIERILNGNIGADNLTAIISNNLIIETGSNANGHYQKRADGTLECWGTKSIGSVAVTTATDNLYINNTNLFVTWPVEFFAIPEAQITISSSSLAAWLQTTNSSGAMSVTQSYGFRITRGASASLTDVSVSFCAKGRWK